VFIITLMVAQIVGSYVMQMTGFSEPVFAGVGVPVISGAIAFLIWYRWTRKWAE